MPKCTFEVCVDNLASLDAAVAGGADRIELCAALSEGGLTPSAGFMQAASASNTSVHAMIRPRGGDFCYSHVEIDLMCADIAQAKQFGLQGVVLGAATAKDELDHDALARLRGAADGIECTIHRVIDLTPDPISAAQQAIGLGMDRILTSGGALKAIDGLDVIAQMVRVAGGRIDIMPGSGVSVTNVERILAATGVKDIHASCSDWQRSVSGRVEAMAFTSEQGVRQTITNLVEQMRAKVDSVREELTNAS